MRLIGSDKGLKEISINDGSPIPRQKDGTFHVNERVGKNLVKSGDFAVAGITFQNADGWRCTACSFVGLFRDKCGRCGCTELVREEEK